MRQDVVNVHPGIYKIINACKYFFPPKIRKKSLLLDLKNRSPTKSEYGNGLGRTIETFHSPSFARLTSKLYLEFDPLSANGATSRKTFCGDHGSLEKGTKIIESLDKCETFLRISQSTHWFLSRGKKILKCNI